MDGYLKACPYDPSLTNIQGHSGVTLVYPYLLSVEDAWDDLYQPSYERNIYLPFSGYMAGGKDHNSRLTLLIVPQVTRQLFHKLS